MSFADKVVLWVMQGRDYLLRLIKRQIFFFHTLLFCSKTDFRSANFTSGQFFFQRYSEGSH